MHLQFSITGPSALITVLSPSVQMKEWISSIARMTFKINIFIQGLWPEPDISWSSSFWQANDKLFDFRRRKEYPALHGLSYISNTTCRKNNIFCFIYMFLTRAALETSFQI